MDTSLCAIPAKKTNYCLNGSGRDTYIYRTNGGFYPDMPVAELQHTFHAKLREHPKTPINEKNMQRAKSSLMKKSFKQGLDKLQYQTIQYDPEEIIHAKTAKKQTYQSTEQLVPLSNHELNQRKVKRPPSSASKMSKTIEVRSRPKTPQVSRPSASKTLFKTNSAIKNGDRNATSGLSLFKDIVEDKTFCSGKGRDQRLDSAMKSYQKSMDERLSKPKRLNHVISSVAAPKPKAQSKMNNLF